MFYDYSPEYDYLMYICDREEEEEEEKEEKSNIYTTARRALLVPPPKVGYRMGWVTEWGVYG